MEVDLLHRYPRVQRDISARGSAKTPLDQSIARKFDWDFFDGDRKVGYGGYSYHEKFWSNVVKDFQTHWNLRDNQSLLDVGCGKGFMLFDFLKLIPSLKVMGLDISRYAVENAIEELKCKLIIGDAKELPFATESFDYVVSINTIHNLPIEECVNAIHEIERVSRKGSFIVVDAYETEEEREQMYAWNLTAQTILSKEQWRGLFEQVGYSGDFFWFTP